MDLNYEVISLPTTYEYLEGETSFINIDNCPVCSSNNLTLISVLKNSLESSVCNECTHIFHSKRPDEVWYAKWYSGNWDLNKDTEKKSTFKKTIKSILRPIIKGRKPPPFPRAYNFCEKHLNPIIVEYKSI